MKRFRFPIPISIVVFLALTMAGMYWVRKGLLERTMLKAMEIGDTATMRRAAQSWPSPVDVRMADGDRPLHVAARAADIELARMLLAAGADPNARGQAGARPLHRAAAAAGSAAPRSPCPNEAAYRRCAGPDDERKALAVVAALLEAGADARSCDNSLVTPLHVAARVCAPEITKRLLGRGADAGARADGGVTPLHAASGGELPPESWSTSIANGETDAFAPAPGDPLSAAQEETLRVLLAAGAQVNAADDEGNTALQYAALDFDPCACRVLLDAGADANTKTPDNWRPLHRASWIGARRAAELLIAHGADVNARNGDGNTPLHCAVRDARTSTVRLLIEKGADLAAKDKQGRTPLALAQDPEASVPPVIQKPVIELLLKAGAKE